MIEYKQGVDARVPVVLDSGSVSLGGVAYTRVLATVKKSDGTEADASPTSALYWHEATTGAFAGEGEYDLIVPGTLLNVPGVMIIGVKVDGCQLYRGVIKVIANEESETYALAAFLKKLKTNKAVVDSTTCVLTVYDDDGVTPLLQATLKDAAGTPSATSVYQRIP